MELWTKHLVCFFHNFYLFFALLALQNKIDAQIFHWMVKLTLAVKQGASSAFRFSSYWPSQSQQILYLQNVSLLSRETNIKLASLYLCCESLTDCACQWKWQKIFDSSNNSPPSPSLDR